MKLYMVFILAVFTVFAFAQRKTIMVRSNQGIVELTMRGDTTDIGMIVENIAQRIEQMDSIMLQNPQCTELISQYLTEIMIIISILPHDVMAQPIPVDVFKAMSDESFNQFLLFLEGETFSDDKLILLRQVAAKNYFACWQIGQIIDRFEFSEDKLEAVRITFTRIVDPGNTFTLRDKFTFDTDKEEFMKIISE